MSMILRSIIADFVNKSEVFSTIIGRLLKRAKFNAFLEVIEDLGNVSVSIV